MGADLDSNPTTIPIVTRRTTPIVTRRTTTVTYYRRDSVYE